MLFVPEVSIIALVTVSPDPPQRLPLFTSVPPPALVLVMVATFVNTPPVTDSTLPVAAPLPMVTVLPSKFHTVLPRMLTVLFDEPLPMVKPVLQTLALVTVMVLKPPPAEPTVTKPPLVRVTLLTVRTSKLPALPMANDWPLSFHVPP